jgi:1-acyl-sn-glycerol-3-phosphate acyltransferase
MLASVARFFVSPLARAAFRPRVRGRRNVPRRGGVILASNHLSFVDSVVITLVAPRMVSFLAKSDYFTGTGAKGLASRVFFRTVGAVPVERGAGQAAQVALDAGLEILDRGDAFAIYPEGTRSLDGLLYRGKTGVAWLAMTAGVPVVPVGLIGTDRLQPVGSNRIHRAKVTVKFGKPMDLSRFGTADSGRARRQATDAVMAEIQKLSGQKPAGRYNDPPPANVAERVRQAFRRERL